jgi:hypothetical protein
MVGVVAAAANGAGQVAQVGNLRQHRAADALDQVTRALLGVRHLLPQGHAAAWSLDRHNASFVSH